MSKFVPKFKKNRFDDEYDSKDRNRNSQKEVGRKAKSKMKDMLDDVPVSYEMHSKRR